MSVIKDKYSDKKVNLIHQMLLNEKEAGNPKDFDIRVDDLKVISRSNDIERFFDHEDFIQDDTRSITICLYEGNSRRCTRYVLMLKEDENNQQQNALAGIEASITDKMAQERKKWEYEQLQKENEELRQLLEESDKYTDQLESRLHQLTEEKNDRSNRITETLVGLAGVYIAKNPNALDGIPLIGGLLSETVKPDDIPSPETKVSFEKMKADKPASELFKDGKISPDSNSKPPGEQAKPQAQMSKTYIGKVSASDINDMQQALIPFFKPEHIKKAEEIIIFMYYNNHAIAQMLEALRELAKGNTENDDETDDDGIEGAPA